MFDLIFLKWPKRVREGKVVGVWGLAERENRGNKGFEKIGRKIKLVKRIDTRYQFFIRKRVEKIH